MANLEAQLTSDGHVEAPSRETQYRLAYNARPRGLVSQITSALFQPGEFFRVLPVTRGRQWLIIAVLILGLVGFVAVRQAALLDEAENGGGFAPVDAGMPPDMGFVPEGDFSGIPPDMGFVPEDVGVPESGGTSDVSSTWTTALVAAAGVVVVWGVQSVLLMVAPMFNGRAPKLGQNLQVAVWASLPLALMAIVQLLYYAGGGAVGEPGLVGLVPEWDGFVEQSPMGQALILSLASRLTLFWLWSLLLLYFGARYALRGRWWASLLVVAAWVAFSVVAPVITGQVTAPETEVPIEDGMMGETPIDGEMSEFPPDGEMPVDGEVPLEGEPPMEMPEGEMSSDGVIETNIEREAPEGSSRPDDTGASEGAAVETEGDTVSEQGFEAVPPAPAARP